MRFNRFNLFIGSNSHNNVNVRLYRITEENYTTGKRKRYYGHHYSQYQK